MSDKLFLLKIKDSEDRDSVWYVEEISKTLECGHYFSSVNVSGACFSCGLKGFGGDDYYKYDEILTVLSEVEYLQLIKFSEDMSELKYGITVNDDRYNKGVKLIESALNIFDKLKSPENKDLFEVVVAEEVEVMKNEYNLSDSDIETIFDEYYLEYRDRGILGSIFEDTETMGEELAEEFGLVESEDSKRYFDFEKFGDDLTDGENYLLLDDERVISLNY